MTYEQFLSGHPPAICKGVAVAVVVSVVVLWPAMTLLAQTATNAPPDQPSFSNDTWHVNLSPYLWMAGLDGTVGFRKVQVQVKQSFTDIFDNLKFGVMGVSDVRRGPIGFVTDLMYIRLGNEPAIPVEGLPGAINVKTSLNTFTLTPYFSYRIFGNRHGSIDFFSGGRYYHINSTIRVSVGGVGKEFSASNNWGDLVEGGRFTLHLTPRIRVFFVGDAGGIGSVLTWQIVGGAGYQWSKRWSTELGYRRLYFNRQTNNGFGLEQTQQGLIVGATFRLR